VLTTEQPANGILEEFRLEFREFWRRLPDKTLFFVLLAAWLVLFQVIGNSTLGYVHSSSLFVWMYSAYHSPITEELYAMFVPIVVLGLFWWKREELLKPRLRNWWPGLMLVLLGLFMALFVGIYGLMGVVWGPGFLRASFFPFCLFVFCVPLGDAALAITFRLRLLLCYIVEAISHYILQVDIIREGTALKDPTGKYQYEVAAACSGMRSFVSTIGLAIVYGTLVFRPWWKRGLIFLSAIPLAILGNTLRMLTIIIASEIAPIFGKQGQDWGNIVHENMIISILPYILTFVGLFALGYWLGDRKPRVSAATSQQPVPAAQLT
jgi:exosortase